MGSADTSKLQSKLLEQATKSPQHCAGEWEWHATDVWLLASGSQIQCVSVCLTLLATFARPFPALSGADLPADLASLRCSPCHVQSSPLPLKCSWLRTNRLGVSGWFFWHHLLALPFPTQVWAMPWKRISTLNITWSSHLVALTDVIYFNM